MEKQHPSATESDLSRELGELERILSEVKAVTDVSTYDDIFPRYTESL
jgi:hypothetical protein